MCNAIDGQDVAAVDGALTAARAVEDRPSLIVARTHIGYGSPKKQDTFQAHGEPLGADEVRATKRALGWPEDPPFHIPDDALQRLSLVGRRGADARSVVAARNGRLRGRVMPTTRTASRRVLAGELPDGWQSHLPAFTPADGEMATRDAGGKVLDALAAVVPNLVGGSADLDPSTRTAMKGRGDFESPERPARRGRSEDTGQRRW